MSRIIKMVYLQFIRKSTNIHILHVVFLLRFNKYIFIIKETFIVTVFIYRPSLFSSTPDIDVYNVLSTFWDVTTQVCRVLGRSQ